MSVPKHCLLGGWYPRGIIVHQQWYRPSDSNTNVDIKLLVYSCFMQLLHLIFCYCHRKTFKSIRQQYIFNFCITSADLFILIIIYFLRKTPFSKCC